MDYEKAYKEALKRAKNLPYNTDKEAAEFIFPELSSEDEKIRREIISALNMWYADESLIHPFGKYTKKQAVSWLEKLKDRYIVGVDMGTPTGDKGCVVYFENKPEFKAGDWVVNKDGSPFSCGKAAVQITHIDGKQIWLESKTWTIAERIRIWTIQDAKDGDVLAIDWTQDYDASHFEKIVIFKDLNKDGVEGYGSTFKNGQQFFNDESIIYSKTWTTTLHPATKEQRDKLEKAMFDAGYEWNNEKKELKQLSQSKVTKISGQEWSEEDEHRVGDTIYFLDTAKKHYASDVELNACIDWLKSLKDRIIK